MREQISRALAGSSEVAGSSRSRRLGRLNITLARQTWVRSQEESKPHFVLRKGSRSNLRSRPSMRSVAPVLPPLEIAGERDLDRGQVGAFQGQFPVRGCIPALDHDAAGTRIENARNQIDRSCFPTAERFMCHRQAFRLLGRGIRRARSADFGTFWNIMGVGCSCKLLICWCRGTELNRRRQPFQG